MPVGNGKVQHAGREVLLDVTRLVWRAWRGQRPTGIDRVCLAYVEHFRERALAVIQREGFKLVLPEPQSDTLFALFLAEGRKSKLKVSAAIAGALLMGMGCPRLGRRCSTSMSDIPGWTIRRCRPGSRKIAFGPFILSMT